MSPIKWIFVSFFLLFDDVTMTLFFPPPQRDALTCVSLYCGATLSGNVLVAGLMCIWREKKKHLYSWDIFATHAKEFINIKHITIQSSLLSSYAIFVNSTKLMGFKRTIASSQYNLSALTLSICWIFHQLTFFPRKQIDLRDLKNFKMKGKVKGKTQKKNISYRSWRFTWLVRYVGWVRTKFKKSLKKKWLNFGQKELK